MVEKPILFSGPMVKAILVLRDEYWKPLWQSINGPESWNRNDWVFVYDFKVLEVRG